MQRIPQIMQYIHRGVWVATGFLCYVVAIDGLRKGRSVSDFIILLFVGTLFIGLTVWVIWRSRRAKEQEATITE